MARESSAGTSPSLLVGPNDQALASRAVPRQVRWIVTRSTGMVKSTIRQVSGSGSRSTHDRSAKLCRSPRRSCRPKRNSRWCSVTPSRTNRLS